MFHPASSAVRRSQELEDTDKAASRRLAAGRPAPPDPRQHQHVGKQLTVAAGTSERDASANGATSERQPQMKG
ncbi:hypothetical protein HBI14_235420 [Parastagonospora nodorum]|nr:hypothetical protein HBI14_235420 [Parastagonospora nodorum]